jgi:hypothetical protein
VIGSHAISTRPFSFSVNLLGWTWVVVTVNSAF